MESVIFDNMTFVFPKLKILEITGDIIVGKIMICPALEELYLIWISSMLSYEELLSGSLTILFVSSRYPINQKVQTLVRRKCLSLTQVTFTYEKPFRKIPCSSPSREARFYRRELRQVVNNFFSHFKCPSGRN